MAADCDRLYSLQLREQPGIHTRFPFNVVGDERTTLSGGKGIIKNEQAYICPMQNLKWAVIATFLLIGCGKNERPAATALHSNHVEAASGLALYEYEGYTVVKVLEPWPGAKRSYTYVLWKRNAKLPDSLRSYPSVEVPVRSIVVTSTTHIPSLEMLGVEKSLTGFPNTRFISSERTRARIDAGHVKELGGNRDLDTEAVLDLHPDVVIGNGIDDHNPAYDNLMRAGIPVMLNGDWNEKTPLGRAEWIKFFGVLFGKEAKADALFRQIRDDYQKIRALARKTPKHPTILVGAMYQDVWNLPQGGSWGALFIADAGGDYLWKDTSGTGSLQLPFEQVFERGQNADFWIGPGQFASFAELDAASDHYREFRSYQQKTIFSFSSRKGKTGGMLYYELAPNRPDLVLRDLVSILHPELLPNHRPVFFDRLR